MDLPVDVKDDLGSDSTQLTHRPQIQLRGPGQSQFGGQGGLDFWLRNLGCPSNILLKRPRG